MGPVSIVVEVQRNTDGDTLYSTWSVLTSSHTLSFFGPGKSSLDIFRHFRLGSQYG